MASGGPIREASGGGDLAQARASFDRANPVPGAMFFEPELEQNGR